MEIGHGSPAKLACRSVSIIDRIRAGFTPPPRVDQRAFDAPPPLRYNLGLGETRSDSMPLTMAGLLWEMCHVWSQLAHNQPQNPMKSHAIAVDQVSLAENPLSRG
jgi:hypothetical protein